MDRPRAATHLISSVSSERRTIVAPGATAHRHSVRHRFRASNDAAGATATGASEDDGALPSLQHAKRLVDRGSVPDRRLRGRVPGLEESQAIVRRGEKGIAIMAPIVRQRRQAVTEDDDPVVGFRAAYVFDGLSRDSDHQHLPDCR
jgi:hypothetical protein